MSSDLVSHCIFCLSHKWLSQHREHLAFMLHMEGIFYQLHTFLDFTVKVLFHFYKGWIQHKNLLWNWGFIVNIHKSMPILTACVHKHLLQWHTCIRGKRLPAKCEISFSLNMTLHFEQVALRKIGVRGQPGTRTKHLKKQTNKQTQPWLHICCTKIAINLSHFYVVLWILDRSPVPQIRVEESEER